MALAVELEKKLSALAAGARLRRGLPAEKKNLVLREIADAIDAGRAELLAANAADLARLGAEVGNAFRDRLTLNERRIAAMIESLRSVAALSDPVNEPLDERKLPNGLRLRRLRAPLGVIFLIFEARPNVIAEAFSLAFKSGNGIILRGGSESAESGRAIYSVLRAALARHGLEDAVFFGVEDFDRGIVDELLRRPDLIDVVIPRGGERLIEHVQKTALMPLIKNDRGLCHTFVDDEADLEMAVSIVLNAKTQRPGVCNALETVLVHAGIAEKFLPLLHAATVPARLAWKGDPRSLEILRGKPGVSPADEASWDTEYLDLVMNCRVVEGLDEALEHIRRHGSRHSEAIVTASEKKARRFQDEVDAAAVYWNASTRFTDGGEFGLGGEIGISTQKLHVRGPVGLRELTSARWIIDGQGQVRS